MDQKDMSPLVPTLPSNLTVSALYRRRKSHDNIANVRDTFNCDDYGVISCNSNLQQVQHAGY